MNEALPALPPARTGILDDLCDRLTTEYLRPALREAGIPDADQYRFFIPADDTPAEATS